MTDIEKTIQEAQAAVLPFESWERLTGESGAAFSAFCVFRDYGLERNIRKAIESVEKDETVRVKRYRMWLNWSTQFRWRERAADYDRYIEHLKQTEVRKTIEAQGEKQRKITGQILDTVSKKLESFNPIELTQDNVIIWAEKAIKAEREAAALILGNGKAEAKQGELSFPSDFDGI
jgi:hypothetical protein